MPAHRLMFTEHLLCPRLHAGGWRHSREMTQTVPALLGRTFQPVQTGRKGETARDDVCLSFDKDCRPGRECWGLLGKQGSPGHSLGQVPAGTGAPLLGPPQPGDGGTGQQQGWASGAPAGSELRGLRGSETPERKSTFKF